MVGLFKWGGVPGGAGGGEQSQEPDFSEPRRDGREGATEGEGRHNSAEDRDEDRRCRRSEEVADERGRRDPHHEEFERRPTEELEHVERRRDVRPASTEDGPEAHHRRDAGPAPVVGRRGKQDRKSTRLNSSHSQISYAVFCLTKKKHHLYNSPHA